LIPLAALFFVGACDEDGAVKNASLPPLAYVRYVNAVPDVATLDFKFIDGVEFSPSFANSPFRTIGIYQGARAGSRQVRVFRADTAIQITSIVIGNATLNLVAGNYYTILHSGYTNIANGPAATITLIDDTRPAQSPTQVHVSGFNTSRLGTRDFHSTAATGTTLVGSVPFASAVAMGARSAYVAQAAAAFAVQGAAAGSTVSLAAAAPIAGAAGTALVDPVAGHSQPGTQFTAFFFSPSIAGSGAPAAFTTSGMTIVPDRQPPRTVPD
jgi:hypothetical protein